MPEDHALPRSRFWRQARAGLVLTERDETLLADLFVHRAMRRDQIQELYFGSLTRCSTRLRLLFDHGYLRRSYPPGAAYVGQAIYSIAAAAVPIVARRLQWEEGSVRELTRKSPTPTFWEHTLGIVDFYLAARRSVAAQSQVRIGRWLPEVLCRHEYDVRVGGGAWRREVFKPDAYISLQREANGQSFPFFLEIDLGHTSARQFGSKATGYERYLDGGLFLELYGAASFRVLIVTTGEGRLRHLLQVVKGSGVPFLATTLSAVAADGPLAHVWMTVGEQPSALLP
ncbi:MAG TPA: replication-relaxation family protein [Armatimonadota bacterium]|jgi:hypothetical protein